MNSHLHLLYRVANLLMNRINITNANLIAQESNSEKAKRAGQSTVSVTSNPECNTRGSRPKAKVMLIRTWQQVGATAINEFFDVKSYTARYAANEAGKREASIEYVFYGIAENTTAAAYAFEMVRPFHN